MNGLSIELRRLSSEAQLVTFRACSKLTDAETHSYVGSLHIVVTLKPGSLVPEWLALLGSWSASQGQYRSRDSYLVVVGWIGYIGGFTNKSRPHVKSQIQGGGTVLRVGSEFPS